MTITITTREGGTVPLVDSVTGKPLQAGDLCPGSKVYADVDGRIVLGNRKERRRKASNKPGSYRWVKL